MKTAQADLTTGPLGKKIFRFSIPLIFSNLLQVLFNMADVAVVGRFAGSTALGAVGSTTIFVSLFTGFLIGLSGGVNVLVAHHFGADDQKNLSDTVHSAALTCAAAGLVLLGIGCGFAGASTAWVCPHWRSTTLATLCSPRWETPAALCTTSPSPALSMWC